MIKRWLLSGATVFVSLSMALIPFDSFLYITKASLFTMSIMSTNSQSVDKRSLIVRSLPRLSSLYIAKFHTVIDKNGAATVLMLSRSFPAA